MEKIAVASDHGGYELKEIIAEQLHKQGYEVENLGTNSGDSVDYPDYAHMVAQKIAAGEIERAILVCGTGIGMSITANRYQHVRAALCNDVYSAKMSRLHNNSNVLVLGGRVIGTGLALDLVLTWANTEFEGGRHQTRLNKIERSQLENTISQMISDQLKENGEVDENIINTIVKKTIDKLIANGEKEKEK